MLHMLFNLYYIFLEGAFVLSALPISTETLV